MASNGYIRWDCHNCLFHVNDCETGYHCILNDESLDSSQLQFISAYEYNRNPELKSKYDEKCEHRTDIDDLRKEIRKKFNITVK